MNTMDESLFPLFQMEAESQCAVLNEGLLSLEAGDDEAQETFNTLMRASHALKGAAAVVGLGMMVKLAHAMEDCFTACIQEQRGLVSGQLATLLAATDVMAHSATLQADDVAAWQHEQETTIPKLMERLLGSDEASDASIDEASDVVVEEVAAKPQVKRKPSSSPSSEQQHIRLDAQRLDALMSLTGEVQLSVQDIQPMQQEVLQLQKLMMQVSEALQQAQGQASSSLVDAEAKVLRCREMLRKQWDDLYQFERKMSGMSQRLSYEILDSRMQKFGDAVTGFRRLVHDTASALGKKVRLRVTGEDCDIDRDILEKIQAPLQHILRNAVDHGIEPAAERIMHGKPEEAEVHLHAYHQGGRLLICVTDDGGGIHWDALRQSIVEKGLSTHEMVAEMNEQELLDFLLLPQFSLKQGVSEISGRGVGLDLVAHTIRLLRGQFIIHSEEGQGSCFEMHLPLSLSIGRCLLVGVAGASYAMHLSRICEVCVVSSDEVYAVEACPCVHWRDESVPVLSAGQVLGDASGDALCAPLLSLVIVPWHQKHYALLVDALLGEGDIIEKPLDQRFGSIKNISGGAVDAQGNPLLVLDVDDVLLSMQQLIEAGHWEQQGHTPERVEGQKSILVVEDSITVREAERRMLENHGYRVYTAVDGMDGWHALRMHDVDLVISDIDMPRMNGLELLRLIRSEAAYRDVPVMIVSYKDREEDRMAGLQAGANYYLTKSSFHDDTMLQGVRDLIGMANG